jgi:hypothetical protein
MEDGRIFLKNLRDTSSNKDLSNEPNFGLIHLAGTVPLKHMQKVSKILKLRLVLDRKYLMQIYVLYS